MSLENSLKRQKSPLATGQEPHPPLTQHGHGKDLVAIEDARNSKDSAIGDAKNPEDSAIGDAKNPEDSADGDAKNSKDLWLQAYEALKRRDKDLVAAYEHRFAGLASTITNSADPSLSPELIETIINSELQHRESAQWVVMVGKKPVRVREQVGKVIIFIIWSNDIVSQALSAQPYAALAWSGVSILLPVSCTLI